MLLVLRVVVVVGVVLNVPHYPSAAADRFFQIAQQHGVPYRDYPVEYPIGDLVLFKAIGFSTADLTRVLLGIVAFASDLVAFGAIAYGWGKRAARHYLWLGTPLLIFIYRRSDLLAVALAVLGLAWAKRGRQVGGGLALAAGTLVKLWPVLVAPALLLARRGRAAWAFALSLAAGMAVWVALGGVSGIRQVATFRGASGWEVESSVGAVVWAITGQHRFEEGANRTGHVPGWAHLLMAALLVATVLAVWLRARHRDEDPSGAPALVVVAVLLLLSPLLSPQFASWLLPWGAVAAAQDRRWLWLTLVPVGITGALVASWYVDLHMGSGWNQLILTARNTGLLVIPVVWFLRREPRGLR
jgi:Glycosyltransferase family 87